MQKLLNAYKAHIIIAIFCLMLGALLSAIAINMKVKSVVVVDLEKILNSKAKEYSQISDEKEREEKLNKLTAHLKKVLPQLGSKIVIKNQCILHVSQDYQVLDKTNLVMKKLP